MSMLPRTRTEIRLLQQHLLRVQDQWASAPEALRRAFLTLVEPAYEISTGVLTNGQIHLLEDEEDDRKAWFTAEPMIPAHRAWVQEYLLLDLAESLRLVELAKTYYHVVAKSHPCYRGIIFVSAEGPWSKGNSEDRSIHAACFDIARSLVSKNPFGTEHYAGLYPDVRRGFMVVRLQLPGTPYRVMENGDVVHKRYGS